MPRKKKLINNTNIPEHEIEKIARCLLPDILSFYNSEEGQKEFDAWKETQAKFNAVSTLLKKNGMKLEKEALDKLEGVFEAARSNTDFGNGRYVRNIFEQAKMNQASRLLEKDFDDITSDEITTITAEDIVAPENKRNGSRRIGFC